MLGNIITKLAVFALQHKRLSIEQKGLVMKSLLANIGALPLRGSISYDAEGTITVNGKKLQPETAKLFVDSCKSLQDNFANNVFDEQLTYLAIQTGVHSGLNTEQIMFSKAALWTIQEKKKLLADILAQR
jgi:hypothetical protein